MAEFERKLDRTTYSMDVLSLNNLVVSLRPLVNRVKVHVISKLSKQIKQYRNKKGSDDQKAANVRKADRLSEEILTLKDIKIDDVAKYCLGNSMTVDQAAKTNDIRTRVLSRVATHKLMEQKVLAWRDKHQDWKALADFILSKNTGRRIKKKKPTNITQSNETAKLESSVAIIKESVSRKEQLMGKQKNTETNIESENLDCSMGITEESINSSSSKEEVKINKDSKSSVIKKQAAEDSIEHDDMALLARLGKGMEKGVEMESERYESEDEDDDGINDSSSDISEENSDSNTDIPSQNPAIEASTQDRKENKEMVVTQLNLNELSEDAESIQVTRTTAPESILFDAGEVVKIKRKRDSFFARESGDESSESEEEEKEQIQMEEKKKAMKSAMKGKEKHIPGKFEKWNRQTVKGKPVSEKLHPSWEASRKRKQQQNTIATFTGKKIKFDD